MLEDPLMFFGWKGNCRSFVSASVMVTSPQF